MRKYAQGNRLHTQALLLLGDNWYGAFVGGAKSGRRQTQFEEMYPPETFDCATYVIFGNHVYQYWPESKVEAELAYTKQRKTRRTMPSRWYRFTFPEQDSLITFLVVDSNMPFADGRESIREPARRDFLSEFGCFW